MWRVHRPLCLPQPFSKSATEHVQGHLAKRQVPPDLFQVCAKRGPQGLPAQPGSHSGAVTNPHLPPLAIHRRDLSEPPRGRVPEIHREVRAGCVWERRGRERLPEEGCGWRGGGKPPLVRPQAGSPGPVNASVREPLRVWASPVTAASVHPPALPSAGHLQACPGPFSREQGSTCAPFPPTDCQAPCWAPVG